ncbi:hypothetical protein [Ekhidna sp.]|jgi:hypothetical protein|uniref:hypothetical protein n=1 Tax=Ekhidna sp. TaxID=2608089 RepID=UPI0032EBA83B
MKKRCSTIILFLCISLAYAQNMTQEHLQLLEGQWTGDLVYLDYSSNKEVKIPVEVSIEKVKEAKYKFNYVYPKEPKANSKSNVTIDLEKMTIEGNRIAEINERNGQWTIVAYSTGKDNGQKAIFIKTYVIGETSLSIKKGVQYISSDERFMRNEYRLKK